MNATTTQTRINRVLKTLKNVKQSGRGFTALCPCHNDTDNSLLISERGDGSIGVHCFGGCFPTGDKNRLDRFLEATGLDYADLFPNGKKKRAAGPDLSLIDLVIEKGIHPHTFQALGVEDGYHYNRRNGLKIPYYDENGQPYARFRIRLAAYQDTSNFAWSTPKDVGIPKLYGLQHLKSVQEKGYLVLVEGESDVWTLYQHDIPVLGIPGAATENTLTASHVNGVHKVYIIREPITPGKKVDAGKTFVENATSRLKAIDYQGEVYEVSLKKTYGLKDPNELNIKLFYEPGRDSNWNAFQATYRAAFQKALDEATPLSLQTVTPLETALVSKDVQVLFADETLSYLASLPERDFITARPTIKKVFGDDVNLNELTREVARARKEQEEEAPNGDLSDVANAWHEKYHDTWGYDARYEQWRHWTGTHWQEEDKKIVKGVDETIVEELHTMEISITGNGKLDCVIRLAKGKCERDYQENEGCINFKNGTLDIADMGLRPHRRDDNLTYCLPYDYVSGAHSHIDETLTAILPDMHAHQAFMAHIGLALLRDPYMHRQLVLYGPPRSGKTTLLNLANRACGIAQGDYVGDSIFSSELEGKRARFTHNERRIACIDELPVEALRQEEVFKAMASHSGVEMRGIGLNEQKKNQWRPKLLITTNEAPHYKDTSGAIKARLVYLHAPRTRPTEEQNIKLIETLKPEVGAFAATCIRLGLEAQARNTYPMSGAMKQLAKRISQSGDTLKMFVEDECILDPNDLTSTASLYADYREYCMEGGNQAQGKNKFSSALIEMNIGISHTKINKTIRALRGIRLRHNTDDLLNEPVVKDDALLEAWAEENDGGRRGTHLQSYASLNQSGSISQSIGYGGRRGATFEEFGVHEDTTNLDNNNKREKDDTQRWVVSIGDVKNPKVASLRPLPFMKEPLEANKKGTHNFEGASPCVPPANTVVAPDRACFHCGTRAWTWNATANKYECAMCNARPSA